MDVFSLQVSLAAPYPGTELLRNGEANGGGSSRRTRPTWGERRLQQARLE